MKVYGKFIEEQWTHTNVAVGGYVVFDAKWVYVETYTGKSVKEDKRCFVKLGTAYLVTTIKKNDGNYLSPESANSLVKDIALKEVVDLDEYNMGFFEMEDIRPESLFIQNDVDEDGNSIPLEVVGV